MPSHNDGILVRAGLSRREGDRYRRQGVGGKERRLQAEPTDAKTAVVEPDHSLDARGQHGDRRGAGEPALGGCPRQQGLAVGNREHPHEPRISRITRLRHRMGVEQPRHDAGLIGSQSGGEGRLASLRRRRSRCGHRGRCPFRSEPRRSKQRQCHGQQKHRHRQHGQDRADATERDDRTGQRVASLHPRMGLATARATRKGGLRWHAQARVSAEA